jgi:histone H3/H4
LTLEIPTVSKMKTHENNSMPKTTVGRAVRNGVPQQSTLKNWVREVIENFLNKIPTGRNIGKIFRSCKPVLRRGRY